MGRELEKKENPKSKPLTDVEFIAKYEAGAIDLNKVLEPVVRQTKPIKTK